jgi:hypothetical protein
LSEISGIEGETGNYTLIFRSGTLQPAESGVIAIVNNPPTADDDGYTVHEDDVLNVAVGSGVLAGDSDLSLSRTCRPSVRRGRPTTPRPP